MMPGIVSAVVRAACAFSLLTPAGGIFPPPADAGAPTGVKGSLDKEIIRRVIRSHIKEVLSCYEAQLTSYPTLAGKVMVNFTVAASGDVVASTLESSTVNEPRVENCIVQAMRRWQFPKPIGGGIVIISYPFVLTPAPIPIRGALNAAGSVEIDGFDDTLLIHRSQDANGVPANGVIFKAERGLILIDTGWTEPQTEAILTWGEQTLGSQWLGAVITHDHADRAGGLGALLRRKIPVAALDLTVAKLAHRGVRGVTTLFTAKAGTFDDERGFQAFYPGPGHARDNIVIAFRADKVVFGGCLIKSSKAEDLGFTGDADTRGLAGGGPANRGEVSGNGGRPWARPSREPCLRGVRTHAHAARRRARCGYSSLTRRSAGHRRPGALASRRTTGRW